MYATPNGIGLEYDAVNYITVANALANGDGFTTLTGNTFVNQPLLYPICLAFPQVFGVDFQQIARYFNAFVFGIVVALSTMISVNWFRSFWFAFFTGIWTLFSIHLFVVSVMAWSEPLFILLTISFLFTTKRYLDDNNTRLLFLSSLFAGWEF